MFYSNVFNVFPAVSDDQRVRGQHELLLLLREQRDGAAAVRKWKPAAESQRPDPRGESETRTRGGETRGRTGEARWEVDETSKNPLYYDSFSFFTLKKNHLRIKKRNPPLLSH